MHQVSSYKRSFFNYLNLGFPYIAQEGLEFRNGRISITNMRSQDIGTITLSHSTVTKVPDRTYMMDGLTSHL